MTPAIPILTARAGRINEAHRKSTEAGRSMLTYAIEAGRELIEVKCSLAHGEFRLWCAAHLAFAYPTAAEYMRAAKAASESMDLHRFEGGLRAFLDSIAEKRPTVVPQLDQNTAERILKLAALATSDNENEAAVARAMLDKMAERFGMTGEEAQVEARRLCPLPPSHDEIVRKVAEINARLDERVAEIRSELCVLFETEGQDEALTIVAETVCRLKFPKEYRRA